MDALFSSFPSLPVFSHFPQMTVIKKTLPFWNKPPEGLHRETTSLFDRVVTSNSAFKLENPEDVATLKSAVQHCKSLFTDTFKEKLLSLPPASLKEMLSKLLQDDLSCEKNIRELLDLLDENQLLKVAGLDKPKAQKRMTKQELLHNSAIQSVLETKGKALWKEIMPEVVNLLHHFIELFISILGLDQIGEGRHNPFKELHGNSSYEAKAKLDLYLTLVGYPAALFGLLYANTRNATTATILTTLLIATTLVFVPIYMRFLRPTPRDCTGMKNSTLAVLRSEEDPVFWRRDILMQIQALFLSGKGAVLVGDPGCGKTSIANSLAEFFASDQCAENFKDVLVFSGSAKTISSLHDPLSGGGYASITHLFRNHRKKAAFFIDEVHAAYKKDGIQGDQSDDLLTFCNKFPYVLAATTPAQLEEHIKKNSGYPAFERRFKEIRIHSPSEKEFGMSLYQFLHKKVPELILGKKVISYIIEKATTFNPKTSTFDAAHSLLSRALSHTQVLSFQNLEDEIHKLDTDIQYTEMTLSHQDEEVDFADDEVDIPKCITDKESLEEKKIKLKQKQTELAKIKKIEGLYVKTKRERNALSAKLKKSDTSNSIKTWTKLEVFVQILSRSIKGQKRLLGLPEMLDKSVIDKILSEENAKTEVSKDKKII